MPLSDFRQVVALTGGGGGSLTYTVPMGNVWSLEAIAFTADLSGAGAAADVKVRVYEPTGMSFLGQLVGNAQPAGSVRRYFVAEGLNACDAWGDSTDAGVPDQWHTEVIGDGCQVDIRCVSPTTGAVVTGSAITNAMLWVAPLGGAVGPETVPLLTPLSPDDQIAA